MTLDEAITDIKTRYTRQDIIDRGSKLLYGKDLVVASDIHRSYGGVCKVFLQIRLLELLPRPNEWAWETGVETLLGHYEIPVGFVPAVPVFHEALGLVVQLKRVLSLLFTDPEMVPACHRFMASPTWQGVVHRLLGLIDAPHGVKLPESPGDVNLMSPAEVEAILRRVVSLPQRGPTQQETVI